MSCVICGKSQYVVRADSVKYPTQTTLPEVLTSVIGNKISSEDWNDGSQHICHPCNKQCEEYDKLNARLQDIKECILQEYSRRVYLDSREGPPPFKQIRLNAQNLDGDENAVKSGDENEETKDKSKRVRGGVGRLFTAHGELKFPAEGDIPAATDAESMDNDAAEKSSEITKHGELSLTIERVQESAPEDIRKEVEATEPADGLITRVTEKSNIRQLPDYEYEQWYTLDGYCFVLRSQNSRTQLLACHKTSCPVTVRTTDGPLARITGEHTHEPDRRIPERNMLYDKLKKRCMDGPTTPIQTIYEEEAKKFPGGASYMPLPEIRMREWRAAKDSTVTIHTDVSMIVETTKKYQCDVCNMGFNSSRLLVRHSRQHERSASPEDDQRKPKATPKKMQGGAAKKMKMTASAPVAALDKKLKKTLDKKVPRVLQKLQDVTGTTTPVTSEIQLLDDDWDESQAEGERGGAWRCHVCAEVMDGAEDLKRHIVARHRDVLMCVHCDVAFDTPRLLKRHTTFCRKCCDLRKQNKERESEAEVEDITERDAGAIEDEDGDPNWDETLEQEDEGDDQIDESDDMPRNKNKSLKCEVCPMSFPRLQQLTQHLYTHSSVKQFECPRCTETFSKKAMLTRHMVQEKHSGQIKVNRPHIDHSRWNQSPGIKFELRTVADNHRYYECAVCSDTFNSEKSLFAHMREQRHKSDKMIVHDRPPQEKRAPVSPAAAPLRTSAPSRTSAPARSKHLRRVDDEYRSYPKLASDGPIVIGGLKFKSKREAMEAWYRVSGKKPVECAVCGAGFDTRIRLLAHMEKEEHLTDSIVENVPELDELGTYYAESLLQDNQIVPSEAEPTIKQEAGRVEILSQVIISPEEEKRKEEDGDEESEPTYVIQTENVNGETVMVIQGDLDGSLHENMQLFMDEEGNIVTQDEDGNTVKVMQVDLSKVQHVERETEEISELDASKHDLGEPTQEEDPNMPILDEMDEENEESKVGLVLDTSENMLVLAENMKDTEKVRDVKSIDGMAENAEYMLENMESAEENMEGTEENTDGTTANMEGVEENTEGLEDNTEEMEGMEENTEGVEEDMKDTEDNIDTKENSKGTDDNIEDLKENVKDIADSKEGTTKNKEEILSVEEQLAKMESGGEIEDVAVHNNTEIVQSAEEISKASVHARKEEKIRKELLTPRKSTRNLEKSEKSPQKPEEKADMSMSSRLRRTKTIK